MKPPPANKLSDLLLGLGFYAAVGVAVKVYDNHVQRKRDKK